MRHKFRSTTTEYQGRKYPSKLAASYAAHLKADEQLLFVLEEVPFRFWDGSRYMLDFMAFYKDGTVLCLETKGRETADFRRKMKLMKREYSPVDVHIVKGIYDTKKKIYTDFTMHIWGDDSE